MNEDGSSTAKPLGTLACVECGEEDAGNARGWRAYLFEDELLVYCADCAAREFDRSE